MLIYKIALIYKIDQNIEDLETGKIETATEQIWWLSANVNNFGRYSFILPIELFRPILVSLAWMFFSFYR